MAIDKEKFENKFVSLYIKLSHTLCLNFSSGGVTLREENLSSTEEFCAKSSYMIIDIKDLHGYEGFKRNSDFGRADSFEIEVKDGNIIGKYKGYFDNQFKDTVFLSDGLVNYQFFRR